MVKKDNKPKGDKPDPPAPPPPDDKKPAGSDLVVAVVTHTIGFWGIVVRPVIDDTARNQPPVIKPVRAVIPRSEAVAAGFAIVGKVPAGAKIGEIIKNKE